MTEWNVKAVEMAGMRSHLFTSLDTLRTALIWVLSRVAVH